MDARSFEMFTKLLSTLSSRQLIKVAAILAHQAADAKSTTILEQAAAANLACPRCRSRKFYGHGEAHDLHRYRCRDCLKTFNSLTGTPFSRLRLKGKWLRYVDCLHLAQAV